MKHFNIAMHHKCATQLVRLFLEDVCALNDLTLYHSHLSTEIPSPDHSFSLLTNANYAALSKVNKGPYIHILRNPLTMIISAYYSHLYSHPTHYWPRLKQQRELLAGLAKEAGLWATLRFLEDAEFGWQTVGPLYALSHWDFSDDQFKVIRTEDLTKDICAELSPLIEQQLGYAIRRPDPEKFSFYALSKGRKEGEQSVRSHYRSGASSGWQDDLPDDLAQHVFRCYAPVFERFYPDIIADN